MATYTKDFDILLTDIVDDYEAVIGSPVAEGTIVWIKSACLASMLWGIYQYQQYIADQPYLATCTTDNLNHWGSIFGIARLQDEIDSDYASRITNFLRNPPAGGNDNDYRVWAQSIRVPVYEQESFSPDNVNLTYSEIATSQAWAMHDSTGLLGLPIPNTVKFSSTGTLPSPLEADKIYYANVNQPTSWGLKVLQVSDTADGAPVTLTDQGSGLHTVTPQEITTYGYKNVTIDHAVNGYVVIYGYPTDVNVWTLPHYSEIESKMLTKFNQLKNCLSSVVLVAYPEMVTMIVTVSNTALAEQIRLDITQFFRDNVDFEVYRERIITLCVNAGDPLATTDKAVYGQFGYFPVLSSLVIKDQNGNVL
jgi:hypothetical protein